jgi:hypothetical protein
LCPAATWAAIRITPTRPGAGGQDAEGFQGEPGELSTAAAGAARSDHARYGGVLAADVGGCAHRSQAVEHRDAEGGREVAVTRTADGRFPRLEAERRGH